jgi:hypothetical protein
MQILRRPQTQQIVAASGLALGASLGVGIGAIAGNLGLCVIAGAAMGLIAAVSWLGLASSDEV